MKTIKYSINFFSEWHAGSGLTSGSNLDALVIKDKNGLPYIPGRTLKGLLREAAEELSDLGVCNEKFVLQVFGKPSEQVTIYSNIEDNSTQGKCFFSNATISEDLSTVVSANQFSSFFYRSVASTAIEADKGVARKHSLRIMETTIPCALFAEIMDVPDEFEISIENCLKWVKRLGQNRNRGLGRCEFKLYK